MFLLRPRPVALSSLRRYTVAATSSPPSLKLVAELRKRTDVTISKAREALAASHNDVGAALKYLDETLSEAGAKKAEQLEGREAKEGLIGISMLNRGWDGAKVTKPRAAMVELNCETDFVARNTLFGTLLADIAHTAAFIADPPDPVPVSIALDVLRNAPLISESGSVSPGRTVQDAIHDLVSKVGEKISLRRAIAVVPRLPIEGAGLSTFRLGAYCHGSTERALQGGVGALVVFALMGHARDQYLSIPEFREDLEKLERAVCRQIVGFPTPNILSDPVTLPDPALDRVAGVPLIDQPFMMYPGSDGKDVKTVLRDWVDNAQARLPSGTEKIFPLILEFSKWSVGQKLVS